MSESIFRTLAGPGVDVLVEPLGHVRSCSVGFWVKRGSCHEGPGEEGLAHFLEHAVFKGTERYPDPATMAAATDRMGGHVDAFTGKESACFYGKVLRDQLPQLVDLLGDLVTTPRFEAEELARERSVILEEIAQSWDQPDDWVSELFYQRFWPEGGLAHPILGTREQVEAFGREDVEAFFRKTYRAGNLLVAASGDLEPDAFLELLAPILARLESGGALPEPPMGRPRSFLLNEPRRELQQTSVVMGFPACAHQHPDRTAANLVGQVLGGGMSSRLFMELREKRALCYQVGSYLTPYRETGALQVAASCAPARVRELVQRTLAECVRLAEDGPEADELERAKRQSRTNLVFGQESTSSRMFGLAYQAVHMDRLRSLDEQMAEIDEVDLDQARRVAREILRPEAFAVAALGARRQAGLRPRDLR